LKTAGGIFHDMMIHDIDQARWMVNSEPIEVFATVTTFNKELSGLLEDTASITLKFKNNTLCIIDTSRRSNKYDQRMEVFCSDGTTDQVGYDPTNKSDCYKGLFNSFEERYEEAYKLELDHFADVLQYNTKQEITENDCIQNTLIADKCCISAIEKRVVK